MTSIAALMQVGGNTPSPAPSAAAARNARPATSAAAGESSPAAAARGAAAAPPAQAEAAMRDTDGVIDLSDSPAPTAPVAAASASPSAAATAPAQSAASSSRRASRTRARPERFDPSTGTFTRDVPTADALLDNEDDALAVAVAEMEEEEQSEEEARADAQSSRKRTADDSSASDASETSDEEADTKQGGVAAASVKRRPGRPRKLRTAIAPRRSTRRRAAEDSSESTPSSPSSSGGQDRDASATESESSSELAGKRTRRGGKRGRASSQLTAQQQRERRKQRLQQLEDEEEVALIEQSYVAAAASSGGRRSSRTATVDGDGKESSSSDAAGGGGQSSSDDDAAAANPSGRPRRRSAQKSTSLSVEDLFRASIRNTRSELTSSSGHSNRGKFRPRRKFLSETDADHAAALAAAESESEEEEEEESSEEEMTVEQEGVWAQLQDRTPEAILGQRDNPEQAKRFAAAAAAKEKAMAAKNGTISPSPSPEIAAVAAAAGTSSSPMEIDDESKPKPSTTAAASDGSVAAASLAAASVPASTSTSAAASPPAGASGAANSPIELVDSPTPSPPSDGAALAAAASQDGAVAAAASSVPPWGRDDETIHQFLVKWAGKGYKHCTWVDEAVLNRFERGYDMIGRFLTRRDKGKFNEDEWEEGIYFPSTYMEVERIVARRGPSMSMKQALSMKGLPGSDTSSYLVKWKDLGYHEATWESRADVEDEAAVALYWQRAQLAPRLEEAKERPAHADAASRPADLLAEVGANVLSLDFANAPDFALRPYQIEGVSWMAFNYLSGRSGQILADEMGLGKTVQIVAFCKYLQQYMHVRGPFLIVAPLSTIPHWQREFALTDLNAVVLDSDKNSRAVFREYELHAFEVDGRPKTVKTAYRFDVMICSYTTLINESSMLNRMQWQLVCVDEAQRSKNPEAKLTMVMQTLKQQHVVLLTGTPLQNNLTELWSLLHTIAPNEFKRLDTFLAEFGALHEQGQIAELHRRLRPYLLRRMKEHVEKNLPPRTEVVVECALTNIQKQFYRAVYDQNIKVLAQLTRGKQHKRDKKLSKEHETATMPSLMNICMQLRHVCNHPYALKSEKSVEVARVAALKAERKAAGLPTNEAEMYKATMQLLIQSSGKFVLLSKLLPRLREQGHRVLLFSQFKKILDLLEDFLLHLSLPYERLDGDVVGAKRQGAIDRFSKPDSNSFVFLLSTKAGGVGINLMSADTVIIFDSDWNPQQDIQAQARAHRIGQTRAVKVYRLITKGTYENEMFNKSSLKLGLDHAVLKTYTSNTKDGPPVLNKEEIENMLKRGAYHVFLENSENHQLNEDDIDVILKRDSRVISYSGAVDGAGETTQAEGKEGEAAGAAASAAAGTSNFAKASFILNGEAIDLQAADFWERVGLKPDEVEAELPRRRARKPVDYRGEHTWQTLEGSNHKKRRHRASDSSSTSGDSDDSSDSGSASDAASSSSSSGSSSLPSTGDEKDESALEKAKKGRRSSSGILAAGQIAAHVKSPWCIHPALANALVNGLQLVGYNRWESLRAAVDRMPELGMAARRQMDELTDEMLKYFALGAIKQAMLRTPVGHPVPPGDDPNALKPDLACSFINALPILRDAETLVGRYAALADEVLTEAMELEHAKAAAATAGAAADNATAHHTARAAQQRLAATPPPVPQNPVPQAGASALPPDSVSVDSAIASLRATYPFINLRSCARCTKNTTLSKCGQCMCVVYCSRQCQLDDWRAHRKNCAHWANHTGVREAAMRILAADVHRTPGTGTVEPQSAASPDTASSIVTAAPALAPATAAAVPADAAAAAPASPALVAATAPSSCTPSKRGTVSPKKSPPRASSDGCPRHCVRPPPGVDIPCEILGETVGRASKFVVHWAGYSRDVQHPDVTEQAKGPWEDTYPELVRQYRERLRKEDEEDEREEAAAVAAGKKTAKGNKRWLSQQQNAAAMLKAKQEPRSEAASPTAGAEQVTADAAVNPAAEVAPVSSSSVTDASPVPEVPAAPAAAVTAVENVAAAADSAAMTDVRPEDTSAAVTPSSGAVAAPAAAEAVSVTEAAAVDTAASAPAPAAAVVMDTTDTEAAMPALEDASGKLATPSPSTAVAAAPVEQSQPTAQTSSAAAAADATPVTTQGAPSVAGATGVAGGSAPPPASTPAEAVPLHLRTAGLPLGQAYARELSYFAGYKSRVGPEPRDLIHMLLSIPVDPSLTHQSLSARLALPSFLQAIERAHIIQHVVQFNEQTKRWSVQIPGARDSLRPTRIPRCPWWNAPTEEVKSGTLDLTRGERVADSMPHDSDLLLAAYLMGIPPNRALQPILTSHPFLTAFHGLGNGRTLNVITMEHVPAPAAPAVAAVIGPNDMPVQAAVVVSAAPPAAPSSSLQRVTRAERLDLPKQHLLTTRLRQLLRHLITYYVDRSIPPGHRPPLTLAQVTAARGRRNAPVSLSRRPRFASLHALTDDGSAELADFRTFTYQRRQVREVLERVEKQNAAREAARVHKMEQERVIRQEQMRKQAEAHRLHAEAALATARAAAAAEHQRQREEQERQLQAQQAAMRFSAQQKQHFLMMEQEQRRRQQVLWEQQQAAQMSVQAEAHLMGMAAAGPQLSAVAAAQMAAVIAQQNADAERENAALMAELQQQLEAKARLAKQREALLAAKRRLEEEEANIESSAGAEEKQANATAAPASGSKAKVESTPKKAKRKADGDATSHDGDECPSAKKARADGGEAATALTATAAADSTEAKAPSSATKGKKRKSTAAASAEEGASAATNEEQQPQPRSSAKKKPRSSSGSVKPDSVASHSSSSEEDSDADVVEETEEERRTRLRLQREKREAEILKIRLREEERRRRAKEEAAREHTCQYCSKTFRNAYLRHTHEHEVCPQRPVPKPSKGQSAAPAAAAANGNDKETREDVASSHTPNGRASPTDTAREAEEEAAQTAAAPASAPRRKRSVAVAPPKLDEEEEPEATPAPPPVLRSSPRKPRA